MNTLTLTWICVFLGATAYFIFKVSKASKDATAANLEFDLGKYIKSDIFDILTAYIICFVVLISGDNQNIPGLELDFETYFKSFASGVGIASIGVNMLLGALGLGDKARKDVREVVDIKTNIADEK